jgi:predicted ATP-dependent serine protease
LQAVDATELLKAGISEEPESLPMLGTLGYFLKGWSHLVAGYPKCGKTELVFASVREWLPEGLSVLWFSEESRAVWQQRLVRHPDLPPGLSLVCAIGAEQSDMLDLARSRTDDVVIIDTLRNLLGLRDENDNAEVARTLGPWETLTGKTRIYLHHERKMGGEHGQAIAGGGAFLGIVDRAIELKYDPHDTKRRQLVVHSRITEAPDLLYELGEDGLKVLGQPDEIALLQVKQRLRETLNVDFQKLVDIQELLDPKPSRSQLQKALREMFRDREVERDPADDKSGATYRWRLIF